ncbi:predicted protein [Chaetomium globosum CBS 148.51]|uniref:Uncharacterized protein n=1 Tax=Chaetomium globosum (strain ATCC 6205 / CBS 148.51 / DSM 1962 / NBRC 6347 / NRRL 1970) TaxID=306901 RepID=Q2HF04_CHAGB|nr:uncharacterized protein CHGG_01200 [Chaetomium globosum CBS 148.51]EAQ92965.1 predicted protein [Chaetomium globosum CBS 148.51]
MVEPAGNMLETTRKLCKAVFRGVESSVGGIEDERSWQEFQCGVQSGCPECSPVHMPSSLSAVQCHWLFQDPSNRLGYA